MDTPDNQPRSLVSAMQQTDMLFPLGTIVNDTYRIDEFIAAGSMGEVYICSHQHLEGAVFALKVLRVSGLEKDMDPSVSIRFKKEVQISLRINHPNVVSSYAFIQQKDYIAFVMEYVKGGDLADYLQYNPRAPVRDVVRILSQSCAGLQAIHEEGITHRDVKPENLLLTEDGDVKITDFGIARIKDGQRLTAQGSVLGTMEYLSPEYLRDGDCDARSDLYAIGLIGYEMLTSKQPFLGRTMIEALHKKMKSELTPVHIIRPDCPVEMSEILRKALEPNPDHRYQNTSEMIMDLDYVANILDSVPVVSTAQKNQSIFTPSDTAPKISSQPTTPASSFAGTFRTIGKEVGDLVKHLSVRDAQGTNVQETSEEKPCTDERQLYHDNYTEIPAGYTTADIDSITDQALEETAIELGYLNQTLSTDTDEDILDMNSDEVAAAYAPPEQADQVKADIDSGQAPSLKIEVFAPQGVEIELIGTSQSQVADTVATSSPIPEADTKVADEIISRQNETELLKPSEVEELKTASEAATPTPDMIDFGPGLPEQLLDLIHEDTYVSDPKNQIGNEVHDLGIPVGIDSTIPDNPEGTGASGLFPWSKTEAEATPSKGSPKESLPNDSFPVESFHLEPYPAEESVEDHLPSQAPPFEAFSDDRIPNDLELKEMFRQGQSSTTLPCPSSSQPVVRPRRMSLFSRLKHSEREILVSATHRSVSTDRLFPESRQISMERLFPRPQKNRFRVFFLFLIFWLVVWSRFLM
jgi:serine/threonine protein kinase